MELSQGERAICRIEDGQGRYLQWKFTKNATAAGVSEAATTTTRKPISERDRRALARMAGSYGADALIAAIPQIVVVKSAVGAPAHDLGNLASTWGYIEFRLKNGPEGQPLSVPRKRGLSVVKASVLMADELRTYCRGDKLPDSARIRAMYYDAKRLRSRSPGFAEASNLALGIFGEKAAESERAIVIPYLLFPTSGVDMRGLIIDRAAIRPGCKFTAYSPILGTKVVRKFVS